MGVKGRRNINPPGESAFLLDVSAIINDAYNKGYIQDYNVDIEAIVKASEDLILEKDFDMESSMSGSLTKDRVSNKWVIKVNAKHHIKRQRFTIAHEFAHYTLHKDSKGSFVDEEIYFRKSSDSAIEYSADKFAAELLMPEDLFRKAIIEKGITKVKELSEIFNVSPFAIEIRAKSLNYKTKSNER